MDTRFIIAYALILFLGLSFISIIFYATREARARRRGSRIDRRERKARLRTSA